VFVDAADGKKGRGGETNSDRRAEAIELARAGRVFPVDRAELAAQVCNPNRVTSASRKHEMGWEWEEEEREKRTLANRIKRVLPVRVAPHVAR
jgi:hypothetical protein